MPSKTPPKDEGLKLLTACCNVPFPKNKTECFAFSENSKIYWQHKNDKEIVFWNPTFLKLDDPFIESELSKINEQLTEHSVITKDPTKEIK